MKRILYIFCLNGALLFFQQGLAQQTDAPPKNWHHLDYEQDDFPGISTEQAYKLVEKRKSTPVIVAVIDSGCDFKHEDLKDKLWMNPNESADKLDNDNNGLVDDLIGWNFIGGESNVNQDTYELTRIYADLKSRKRSLSADQSVYFVEIQKKFEHKLTELREREKRLDYIYRSADRAVEIIQKHLNKDVFTAAEMKAIKSTDETILSAKKFISALQLSSSEEVESIKEALTHTSDQLKYGYNADFDPRYKVGDNASDQHEKNYGNNDVLGPDGSHGTHVAGIIGANRNNSLGIMGVAENVQIMAIRVVPNGDERDKDVANGIRYAVDNGARVVNMSFGKGYSPYKSVVDEAVRYAQENNVLLVHGAGNDGENIDIASNFPNDRFENGSFASNWIEVGASSYKWNKELAAGFSNYGKKSVDIFAPGVQIYSSTPDNNYERYDGTSMASPVVAGVAALILSYFPDLSPEQVKEAIMNSGVSYKKKIALPGEGKKKGKTKLAKISVSGKIINAKAAIQYALDNYKGLKVSVVK